MNSLLESIIIWLENTDWKETVSLESDKLVTTESARDLSGFLVGCGWGNWMRSGKESDEFEIGMGDGRIFTISEEKEIPYHEGVLLE